MSSSVSRVGAGAPSMSQTASLPKASHNVSLINYVSRYLPSSPSPQVAPPTALTSRPVAPIPSTVLFSSSGSSVGSVEHPRLYPQIQPSAPAAPELFDPSLFTGRFVRPTPTPAPVPPSRPRVQPLEDTIPLDVRGPVPVAGPLEATGEDRVRIERELAAEDAPEWPEDAEERDRLIDAASNRLDFESHVEFYNAIAHRMQVKIEGLRKIEHHHTQRRIQDNVAEMRRAALAARERFIAREEALRDPLLGGIPPSASLRDLASMQSTGEPPHPRTFLRARRQLSPAPIDAEVVASSPFAFTASRDPRTVAPVTTTTTTTTVARPVMIIQRVDGQGKPLPLPPLETHSARIPPGFEEFYRQTPAPTPTFLDGDLDLDNAEPDPTPISLPAPLLASRPASPSPSEDGEDDALDLGDGSLEIPSALPSEPSIAPATIEAQQEHGLEALQARLREELDTRSRTPTRTPRRSVAVGTGSTPTTRTRRSLVVDAGSIRSRRAIVANIYRVETRIKSDLGTRGFLPLTEAGLFGDNLSTRKSAKQQFLNPRNLTSSKDKVDACIRNTRLSANKIVLERISNDLAELIQLRADLANLRA